ncbi:recombination regulator RecX [Companilactobacillus mishanensis]|uniref:Regulatory protein RecX n=1 Tax=Companilactobacillus mishanensis TaxID=2486008 RepID=A0A5P0ZFJ3_9LACO|nr:recombination regulator RecX [Companilactobacillus mishanensis]MQS45985.1 recombination regulator RecX [Companilactobacillus mishanensis]MQS51820.1 recombination regulator RecX [Companilactobacillus mishanensis]
MTKVTKIQAQKRKGRYNIYLDGTYAFPVGESTLIEFRLMKDVELTDEEINKIKDRENVNKAYGDAVNYLSYQLRTIKEMKDYLYKKEYESPIIYDVLERLEKLHYLDDEAYAQSFINTQLNTSANGPKIIKQKMFQKGVPESIIQMKMDEIDQDILLENATEFAKKQIHKNRRASFRQQLTKLRQSLYSKGFSPEIINQTMDNIDLEKDEDEESENLRKMIDKVQHRYDNPSKLIKYLMGKGYSYDSIKKALQSDD